MKTVNINASIVVTRQKKNNRLHFVDHNPLNHHRDNLTVVDPLCEAWQNLGALNADDGFVVYLPEIRPEEVNHLQRAAIFALQSVDPVYSLGGIN